MSIPRRIVQILLFAAAIAWLTAVGWGKWGNIIIDTFRDQWVFFTLSQGRVLYKDIYYLYGFLPPYVMAGIYKVLGVNIAYTALLGIGISVATSVFLYKTARCFINRLMASMLVLNFLFVFAFKVNHPSAIFNFIVPYSVASTFFICFLMGALSFYVRFVLKPKRAYAWYGAVFFVGAFLSRPEMACLAWGVMFVAGLLFTIKTREKLFLGSLICSVCGSVFLYALFFTVTKSFPYFYESVIESALYMAQRKNTFALSISGFDNIPGNMLINTMALLAQVSMAVIIMGLSLFGKKVYDAQHIKSRVLVFAGIAIATAGLVVMSWRIQHPMLQFRLLPVLLPLGIICFGYKSIFHSRTCNRTAFALFVLFIVSLALMHRVLLKPALFQYFFFLGVPALICYYLFFVRFIPAFSNTSDTDVLRYYSFGLLVYFAVCMIPSVTWTLQLYAQKNVKIVAPYRGAIYAYQDSVTLNYLQAIDYVQKETAPEATMVVMPEGVGINFLARRDNPMRQHLFTPIRLERIGEESVINALMAHKIDYIVLVHRPTTEYDYAYFGVDYAQTLFSWICEHYRLEKVFGAEPFTSDKFGIAVYVRTEEKDTE